jgi:BclB C-terminal domain-containing protein
MGATGASGGPIGPTGPTGSAGSSAIIPYASGVTPVAVTTLVGGLVGLPAYVGFGSAAPGINLLGATISVSGLLDYAFTVTVGANVSIGLVQIHATVYISNPGSNTFTQTPVTVTLSPGLGLVAIGTIASGAASGFSQPVTTGDQILLVISATNNSVLSVATATTGSITAGITIN